MEIDLPYREMEASPRPIFDAIVVLGSGVTAKTDRTEPGYDGKMRVIAACEALSRGLANNVLFTGGKVYGESLPSEAETMLAYATRLVPTRTSSFKVSETAKDTSTNILVALREAKKEGWKDVALITNRYHARRVIKLASNLGLKARTLTAESLLLQRSGKYRVPIANFYRSREFETKNRSEKMQYWLLSIDPEARIIRFIASRTRN